MVAEFSCCCERQIPSDQRLAAAWHAAIERPENAPGLIDLAYDHPKDRPLPPQAITLLKGKAWKNGTTLRVAFRGGSPQNNAKVLSYMAMWSQWINIDFADVGDQDACDIRVGFDQPGYWSNIGVDSAFVCRQGQVSLNIQGFDRIDGFPEQERTRVICHETGHALMAMHEMLHPKIGERLDWPALYAYMRRFQGWDRSMVDSQFHYEGNPGDLDASELELTSIMMYQLPAEVFLDRQSVPGGVVITERDGQTMAKYYPGRGTPHPEFRSMTEYL